MKERVVLHVGMTAGFFITALPVRNAKAPPEIWVKIANGFMPVIG
jgi:hypothetical protein